jgi:predicted O-linked N-acetylglucosamine transferase (SPINDLY family)
MSSRVAASLLHAAGLDELITTTLADYEELAATLAEDSEKLYAMRRHLENTRENSALFDTARWVRNLYVH